MSTLETGHGGAVHDAQFDFYGRLLATAGADGAVKVFDVPPGADDSTPPTCIATLSSHTGPVWRVAWAHPQFGRVLASAAFDHKLVLWHAPDAPSTWRPVAEYASAKASLTDVAFAPPHCGFFFAFTAADGAVVVATWQSQELVAPVGTHPHGALCVAWDPRSGADGAPWRVVSGGCDATARVWTRDTATGQWSQLAVLQNEHLDWVRAVGWAATPGGDVVATGGQDARIVLWLEQPRATSADDRFLSVAAADTAESPVWSLAFGANGARILAGTEAGVYRDMFILSTRSCVYVCVQAVVVDVPYSYDGGEGVELIVLTTTPAGADDPTPSA